MTDRRGQNLPAGLRNNNAGNILKTSIPWVGKIPEDQNPTIWEIFTSSEYGIRALYKQILSTLNKSGNRVEDFVFTYSGAKDPKVLNNYSNVLKQYIGANYITPNKAGLIKLARGIAFFENGEKSKILSTSEFEKGFDLLNNSQAANYSKKLPFAFGGVLLLGLLAWYYHS